MLQVRNDSMFLVCITMGIAFLASRYRNNVLRSLRRFCHGFLIHNDSSVVEEKKEFEVSTDRVILADSPETCDYAIQRIRCDLSDGVLGIDCEWVNDGPVSLLQLSTFNGVCALFRLGKIGYVPARLKELLANRSVLKVGVAPFDDGRKLTKDFGCRVFGTLDLRMLASRLGLPNATGLAALCKLYLGIEMDKGMAVRCSNWDADTLTEDQVTYAACDAIASVLIYQQMLQRAKQQRSLWENFVSSLKNLWGEDEEGRFRSLSQGVIDARFKAHRDSPVNNFSPVLNGANNNVNNKYKNKNTIPTRSKPLYHNCYLQAPDGEDLCTCERKKAEWYVTRELGYVVANEPYTVRLKFEPSGRAMGEVGRYYTQVKLNQCVVCGSTEKFIRKNVVPREYRKYFPLVMKAHQSHDVLLLCPTCHQNSNIRDTELRRFLAEMCDAPLSGPVPNLHQSAPGTYQKFRSTVKALKEKLALPVERRKELEAYVLEVSGLKEVTPRLLEQLDQQIKDQPAPSSASTQPQAKAHGIKVVKYFENREGGLVELERMWREHFLTTMEPRYLPKLWSVRHNQERLYIRQTQNRIEPEDAKVAGLSSILV